MCALRPPQGRAASYLGEPGRGDGKSAHPPHDAWLSPEAWKDEATLGTSPPHLAQAAHIHYTHPELGSSGEPVPGDDGLKFSSGAFARW